MDGLKLYIQKSPFSNEQNNFYNGWTHDHYVSNILVFCPDGTIPCCCLNVPGSQHDSTVAEWGSIYKKLGDVFNKYGAHCTVDSAFAQTRYHFLIKSSQDLPATIEQIRINNEATSMRQSAEWGMRAFQSSFPRIKDRIFFERGRQTERRLILKLLVRLFNYRAREVGINQILNTYMPHLKIEGNIFAKGYEEE